MDKLFNLRSLKFRQDLLNSHRLMLNIKNEKDMLVFSKANVSDKDLIHVYLILNRVDAKVLDNFLFDYKMWGISEERVRKFMGIVTNETGVFIDRQTHELVTYNKLSLWLRPKKIDKLVDIFLDEV